MSEILSLQLLTGEEEDVTDLPISTLSLFNCGNRGG